MNILDFYFYLNFSRSYEMEKEIPMGHFIIPLKSKLKKKQENRDVLEIYSYPEEKLNNPIYQFRLLLMGNAGLILAYLLRRFIRGFRREYYTSCVFYIFLSIPLINAMFYVDDRVKDVKSIYLREGKYIQLETFKKGETYFEFDRYDLRVFIQDQKKEYIIFMDRGSYFKKRPHFFCLNIDPKNIPDRNIFDNIIYEYNYVKYM